VIFYLFIRYRFSFVARNSFRLAVWWHLSTENSSIESKARKNTRGRENEIDRSSTHLTWPQERITRER